ncbi:MAG: hypothetical protein ACYC96_05650 [Fimbriimonadaceae bacterium]
MNENDLYSKLVDLYAERALPADVENRMEAAAANSPALADEMMTLRGTVDLLHGHQAPEFTEESYQRILLKMYARGIELQSKRPDPIHLQYQLPIQG